MKIVMSHKKQVLALLSCAAIAVVMAGSGRVRAQDGMSQPMIPSEAASPVVRQVDTGTGAPDAPQASLSVEALPTTTNVPAASEESRAAAAEKKATDHTAVLNVADAKGRLRDASVMPENIKTLFFTAWQHSLLQESKIGFTTRTPNPGEVSPDDGTTTAPLEPGIRELSLGGIAYGDGSKWTVWLNGVRVTPDAIPEQVLDIKVGRAFIDLKWFDRYTNKIFPVRLRTHERFNLDSRIFLPGSPT